MHLADILMIETGIDRDTVSDVLKWLRVEHLVCPKIFMTDCCQALKSAISTTYGDLRVKPFISWCFWHVLRAVRKHAKTLVSAFQLCLQIKSSVTKMNG